MKDITAITIGILGVFVILGLIVLTNKLISERYKVLRHIGRHPLEEIHQVGLNHLIKRKNKYKNSLQRNKYSRGTTYDRVKLRQSNRHNRYYP